MCFSFSLYPLEEPNYQKLPIYPIRYHDPRKQAPHVPTTLSCLRHRNQTSDQNTRFQERKTTNKTDQGNNNKPITTLVHVLRYINTRQIYIKRGKRVLEKVLTCYMWFALHRRRRTGKWELNWIEVSFVREWRYGWEWGGEDWFYWGLGINGF